MRNMLLASTLFLAVVSAATASAENLSIHQDNGAGSLRWQSGNRLLALKSDGSSGIQVTRAGPDGMFGLRQGDRILAVDGAPVARIDGLLRQLRASQPRSVEILIRRGGTQESAVLAASAYAELLPPPAPEPPALPSPAKP